MYDKYLSYQPVAKIFKTENFIEKFLTCERMIALAQGELNIIPLEAAREIDSKLQRITPESKSLSESFFTNGIPTIELLSMCEKSLSKGTSPYLHHGLTSQDIIDTSHILMYKEALSVIEGLVRKILIIGKKYILAHRHLYAVARTRTQQAGITTYGLRAVNWFYPLLSAEEGLPVVKSKVLSIQSGGIVGTHALLKDQGIKLSKSVADKLDLSDAAPWHTNRQSIKLLSDWLIGLSASLGKMAKDILFLSSTEVGEILENKTGGGKSSSMPHKSNPVLSEAILALSRENNIESLKINEAMIHGNERDASAWILEWRALPRIFNNTATCLNHMILILDQMELNYKNIERNLNVTSGLIYSALVLQKLKNSHATSESKDVLGKAMDKVKQDKINLSEALDQLAPISDSWGSFLKPENYLGDADILISEFLEKVENGS